MQVKNQQLEPDMEWIGSKYGMEYVKAAYCHLAYLSPCLFNLYAEYIIQNAGLADWNQDCWEKYQ